MKVLVLLSDVDADYALEDYPNVVSVFITGDEADKIKRVSELYNVDEAKAKDLMIKTDKRRSSILQLLFQ